MIERYRFAERLPLTFVYWTDDWKALGLDGWDVSFVLERVRGRDGIYRETSVIALAVKE